MLTRQNIIHRQSSTQKGYGERRQIWDAVIEVLIYSIIYLNGIFDVCPFSFLISALKTNLSNIQPKIRIVRLDYKIMGTAIAKMTLSLMILLSVTNKQTVG